MTNLEYYKDEILDNCLDSLAVVKGRPKLCYKTNCNDCDFKLIQKECHNKVKDWLKQTYKAPAIKQLTLKLIYYKAVQKAIRPNISSKI